MGRYWAEMIDKSTIASGVTAVGREWVMQYIICLPGADDD